MKKTGKRNWAFFLLLIMIFTITIYQPNHIIETVYAEEEDDHYYSQKGWTYNGKTLTSMCYITSYAMILRNMGKDVDPVDVYVANGCSNYVVHSKIASAYNVNVSETGDISGKSVKEKQEFVKNLLEKYPQGIIVGGSYGSGTHYIVVKKVVDDEILFDDPAIGCCVSVTDVYKHTWQTLDMYRVIKDVSAKPTVTPTATDDENITTIKPTATPKVSVKPTTTVKPKATPKASVKPTTTVKPTATPKASVKPTTTVKPTAEPKVSVKPSTTVKPTATPKNTTKPAVDVKQTATPHPTKQPDISESAVPSSTIAPSAKNPLKKYKVPTRTIYYKKKNMTGTDVKWVELAMKTLKYSISVDGKYTQKDKEIVQKYQKKKGLSPDGYFGKDTRKKVISDLEIALTKVNQVKGLSVKKATSVSVTTSKSNTSTYQVIANWNKVTNADGYQLVYSDKKNFAGKKTITKSGKSATIKNLKKGTKYYIKVRAYKTVNNTKVYGSYSNIKMVKF